jgi:hypothetical protein
MQPFGEFSVQGLRHDIIERAADHKHKTAGSGLRRYYPCGEPASKRAGRTWFSRITFQSETA